MPIEERCKKCEQKHVPEKPCAPKTRMIFLEVPDASPITPDEVLDGLRQRGWIDGKNSHEINCWEN